jgi:phosphoadenylyl-sulfate reductase (thioredoxin)
MAVVKERTSLEELNQLEPVELLRWAATHSDRAGIVTSFQNTGCVTIDMAHRAGLGLRVITIDTLRLHPETYNLIERIEKSYGLEIERFRPDPERLSSMIDRHGEYLFFDSPAKQKYCCQIRKVEPNQRALATLDVWVTGLRQGQSASRTRVKKATVVSSGGREILRLSPLVDWTDEQVEAYIGKHDVPYNTLYDQGYTSIGCVICATPTRPGEDKRAGRWRWFNHLGDDHNKACGIHEHGSGI